MCGTSETVTTVFLALWYNVIICFFLTHAGNTSPEYIFLYNFLLDKHEKLACSLHSITLVS